MNHDHRGDFIFDIMFDPADDHLPFIAVKVYLDGNPIELDRFKTEEAADDFIADLKVLEKVIAS
jgi:hypothetical protein